MPKPDRLLDHDNEPFPGPASHRNRRPYSAHADALPLTLQYHREEVNFRNVWVQEISDDAPLGSTKAY
ncbi:MAG: hypothetical protein EA353_01850 [Puniceicoccaceae bacterium]|nr:MAG: hypothetical protein EA353_01850 [Puniceicoccaceae bacterium]